MVILSHLKHYQDMLWLFYKYGQGELLKDFSAQFDMPKVLKERGDARGKAENLVRDLETLGPFYIKLGQILGSGIEILPPEFDEVLQKLQDKVAPMPYDSATGAIILMVNIYLSDRKK